MTMITLQHHKYLYRSYVWHVCVPCSPLIHHPLWFIVHQKFVSKLAQSRSQTNNSMSYIYVDEETSLCELGKSRLRSQAFGTIYSLRWSPLSWIACRSLSKPLFTKPLGILVPYSKRILISHLTLLHASWLIYHMWSCPKWSHFLCSWQCYTKIGSY